MSDGFDMEVVKSEDSSALDSVGKDESGTKSHEKETRGEEWAYVNLEDLCEIGGGSTPSKSNPEYWENGEILWTTPKDFDGPWMDDTEEKITEEGAKTASSNIYPKNTTLVVVRSGVLRHTLPVAKARQRTTVNQDLKALQPYSEKVHPEYFFQAVSGLSEDIRGRCKKTGTTVESIQTSLLRQYTVPVPSLPEQRKIASVLYTVDQAIQKTEEIIEQAKRVKTGLLQDRIFDVSGPECVDRRFGPMKFRVPEEWDRVRLKEVTTLVTRGKQPTYAESGIPVINQKCIYWDGWYFENSRYLDSEVAEEWKAKYFPEKGDVVINSTGRGTLGRAQVYRDSKRRAVDSHVTIVRPDQERLIPGYLRYLLESHRGQSLLYSMCVTGSTGQIELSKSKLKLLSIPLPPVEEQRRIVEMIEQFDQMVRKNRGYAKQLQDLKKGLMQDLLTGEVRTVDRAIEVLEEVQAHG